MVESRFVESPFPEGSGFKDGIYYSKWPVESVPQDPYLDLATYVLDHPYMDRVALVDAPTGDSMTYRELKHKVYAVASGLADVGVKQGDVVMILSLNGMHFPILVLAIAAIGGVVTATNPANLSSEIANQAKDSLTKFVISTPEFVERVVDLKLPLILIDTLVDDNDLLQMKGIIVNMDRVPLAYLSDLYKVDPSKAPKVTIRQTDTVFLLYSSGTTGLSKGVILSHRNAIAASSMANDPNEHPEKQWTFLAAIPLYHVFGMLYFCIFYVKRAARIVIMPKFDFPKYLAAIEQYKVTHLALVPPILLALLKSPIVKKYDLTSVYVMGVGAAPVGKEVIEAVSKRFRGVFLGQGFGMTQTCAMGSFNAAVANAPAPDASVGFMHPHLEARIVDIEFGKSLPPNQKGELWLRGPCIMEGYLNNEKATVETLDKDGWLHTGDIAYFNENGYLYIVDRLKELIKYNGLQVAPAELEAILLSHPEIEDGAVTGFPDEQTGQIPVAFVVRRSSSLTEGDVIVFVAKQVAPYKKVRKVIFVESVPKSPTGKILRKELKAPRTSKL